jgi:hypothetical protein
MIYFGIPHPSFSTTQLDVCGQTLPHNHSALTRGVQSDLVEK